MAPGSTGLGSGWSRGPTRPWRRRRPGKGDAVAGAAAVEEKLAVLARDFKPGAQDSVPAQRAADGEAEVFGGDLGGGRDFGRSDEQGDGAARLAAAGDGEGFPSRANEAGGGKGAGQIG